MTTAANPERHLTIIVCAAGPAADVATLVEAAHRNRWAVSIVATPQAVSFVDIHALEDLTGQPVRSEQRQPVSGTKRGVGTTDALIVAPATFNTINKLAAGIADNYALTLLAECTGLAIPVIVVPFVNTALASRFPYVQALDRLRAEGLRIIGSEAGWAPHPPGTGDHQRRSFPWAAALRAAESV
jgi:phosphopantothenoylcysteine synthetase/decarboxylase